MKLSEYHEVESGTRTLKRNVVDIIKPCPICGTKPTFCRSYYYYGYCMAAVDGIKTCTFKPIIPESGSIFHAVQDWNKAVEWWQHDKLLRLPAKAEAKAETKALT